MGWPGMRRILLMIYCLLTCDLHISAKQMTGSTVRDRSGLAWYEKDLIDDLLFTDV